MEKTDTTQIPTTTPGSTQRQVRQEQPHDTQPRVSRPVIQPLILGDLSLPSPTTQTTVGAAGSASALPNKPTGYLTVNIGNANFVIPYYAPS